MHLSRQSRVSLLWCYVDTVGMDVYLYMAQDNWCALKTWSVSHMINLSTLE